MINQAGMPPSLAFGHEGASERVGSVACASVRGPRYYFLLTGTMLPSAA